ncbi:MAG TPA: DUF58 domain-containing protein [Verrucomicrobiae bacterium]
MRVTRTGFLLAGIAVALYLASLTSQSAFLLLPVGIIGGCLVLNIFGSRRSVRQVQVEPPASTSIAEGQSLSQPWRVENRSKRDVGQLTIESQGETLLQVGALNGKTQANIVPTRQFLRRGVYRFSELKLVSTFPFGLVKSARQVVAKGEVVVYPAIYPAPCPKAAGFDAVVGGKFHGQKRSAAGTHFAGLRPFHAGDPLKQIHWKSSSKGRGLMVKTFEEELSGRVAIITDAVGVADSVVLDDCLRAAGSLMFAALDAGHHVEWVNLATQMPELFPPFTDGQEILDMLARVEPLVSEPDGKRIGEAVGHVSRRSALSFVLTQVNASVEEALESLAAQGRSVTVYLPEGAIENLGRGVNILRYNAREVVG